VPHDTLWDSAYDDDPDDTDQASLYATELRNTRAAIHQRMVYDHEWDSITLGGYHNKVTFIESVADPTPPTDTGILYTKDDGSGKMELFYIDNDSLVAQIISGGALNVYGVVGNWTAGQYQQYVQLTYGTTINSDWEQSNYFYLDITGSISLFANPTNMPSVGTPGGTWVYELRQAGGAAYDVTSWGSKFRWPFGVAPSLTLAVGAVDILVCTLRADGNIHGSLITDSKV